MNVCPHTYAHIHTCTRYLFVRRDRTCDIILNFGLLWFNQTLYHISILSTVSMSREYDSDSMKHTYIWLETVTVVRVINGLSGLFLLLANTPVTENNW